MEHDFDVFDGQDMYDSGRRDEDWERIGVKSRPKKKKKHMPSRRMAIDGE